MKIPASARFEPITSDHLVDITVCLQFINCFLSFGQSSSPGF